MRATHNHVRLPDHDSILSEVDPYEPTVPFHYDSLPPDAAEVARAAAARMNSRLKRTFLETGADLLMVKEHLNHGQFTRWLQAEVAMGIRTAERFMAAAALIAGSDKMSLLPAPTIRAIASSPKPVRDTMVKRIENDEPVTTGDVRRAIEKAKVGAIKIIRANQEPHVVNLVITKGEAQTQVMNLKITGDEAELRGTPPTEKETGQLLALVSRIRVLDEGDRNKICAALEDETRRDLIVRLMIGHLKMYNR